MWFNLAWQLVFYLATQGWMGSASVETAKAEFKCEVGRKGNERMANDSQGRELSAGIGSP